MGSDEVGKVPILEMKGITKRFPGVVANDHVDLELYCGEVLALLGENGAGKSSLMNVLAGLYRPDEGEIYIRGKRVDIESPRDAMDLGIGMVHQNFMLVDTMTVAENIILGLKSVAAIPDMRSVHRKIHEISEHYSMKVDPAAYIWQLSVGEQQRVEILKQIYRGATILILDEPTAVLTPQESDELNCVLQQMTGEGRSAIFITHKMEEVIDFSDWVRVLQKGRLVTVKRTSETNPQELARLMVGREVLFRIEKKHYSPGEVVLELRDIRADGEKGLPALTGINLEVRAGEIMGIAGVAGNGQRELTEVITGLHSSTGGKVFLEGRDMTGRSPFAMIQAGVSHIPSDRIAMGVVGDMSVANNLAMKGYRKPPLLKGGFLNPKRILLMARKMIDLFKISTPAPQTHVKFLSGGNIQKTILAREIDACGGLLVAAYPSRGLDVGATEAVRNEIVAQRDKGKGVLMVSEDLEELLSVADKIAVLFEGQIMGIVSSEEADTETLGLMMAGVPLSKVEEEAAKLAAATCEQE
ncbi:ABC transporter ATP-binding protein [Sediminispirochaeta smaragdinae]|uniref:ABC transporter related protein n=1 Tax=Sediminispirochaeta smaragdinae (strain DSM 11293 / JCM 15392 / SEBR 4228) TaxID=573413 RepID=E1R8W5_SEDSS|nr:ABC transporter ATP-binding protein [Sediminispirochaeta smaragdinae]ADK81872.1 ABC transporter related protein [Sediminispirochaeta smaragdinae DSM 11293]